MSRPDYSAPLPWYRVVGTWLGLAMLSVGAWASDFWVALAKRVYYIGASEDLALHNAVEAVARAIESGKVRVEKVTLPAPGSSAGKDYVQ
jgi:hypothetical protein